MNWRVPRIGWILLLGCVVPVPPLMAQKERRVDYVRDIKPILRNKCSTCHGPLKQESDLRLDAGQLILRSKVVKPGAPGQSELLHRVSSKDKDVRMPPEGSRLSDDQIALVRDWIAAGARFPANEKIAVPPQKHWAFQRIRRPAQPSVKNKSWPTNAIDYFVLAKLEARGWRPNPPAKPAQLLRRAHLDLIGLPPTIKEQEAYATRPDYAALINRLLQRKGYGERYARHWLDIVRYADSNGYERDAAKPQVWRFRDYVIRSLNQDKPFSRFLVEQLAGDELTDANTETVIATGYNRLGPWDDEPADFALDRFDQLDDLVNTTSQAFLGLTMGCSRCHNHKFDPLLQTDYYSMVAIFNPLQRAQTGRTEKTRFAAPPAVVEKLQQVDKQVQQLTAEQRKRQDRFAVVHAESGKIKLGAEVLAALKAVERNEAQRKLIEKHRGEIDQRAAKALTPDQNQQLKKLTERIQALRERRPNVPQGYFLHEASPQPPLTRLLKRGNPAMPGDVVPAAVPRILAKQQPKFPQPGKYTSRRRLTLANWMIRPENPLTARVIVNRVWQWHFGEGLVRTPNDFGLIGQRPTHPQLLDWLAHWFVHEADWSLKKLHRLIMTSRTYQMSNVTRRAPFSADPNNRLLWRHAPHRLEVEAIRDSMLAVSGRLNRKMFGPPMHPYVPRDALLNHADKTKIWPTYDEASASRRTVYAFIKRSLLVPLLEVLDLCDVTQTAPQRKVTTVPTQALTLYNGHFSMLQSKHFAERLMREAGKKPDDQIRLAFRLALARLPSDVELTSMRVFLTAQRADKSDAKAALTQLCRVIFNLNEFVYPE